MVLVAVLLAACSIPAQPTTPQAVKEVTRVVEKQVTIPCPQSPTTRKLDETPRIFIQSAYSPELEKLLSQTKVEKTYNLNGITFTLGELLGNKVVQALSGFSMVNAAANTQLAYDHFNITHHIFSGIAGGVNPQLNIGDVAIPAFWGQYQEALFAREIDQGVYQPPAWMETPFPNFGMSFPQKVEVFSSQNPQGEEKFWFEVDLEMLRIANIAAKQIELARCTKNNECLETQPKVVIGGYGVSGQTFVDNASYREYVYNTFKANVLDMETASAAHVAYANGIPFIAFRSLSDLAGGGPGENEIGTFFQLAADNSATVVLKFLEEWSQKSSAPKIKAGFIYVGPIGDYGWTHAHNEGRLWVEKKFPWLETIYAESVPEADVERFLDRLIVEEKCDVVFTTSFGFMDGTLSAAQKYPDKIFFHCSGFKRAPNLGNYFIDFYQLYYLNGLMAGALTKTGKVGYVAAHPIPEVIRHINAFTLGVREVNPKATVDVRWLFSWYDPAKAREAAEALIAAGCDTLAFTEDSPTVIQVGQEYTQKGQQIYTFSHYSPMESFGPDSCVSGQLVNWGILYEEILRKVYTGEYTNNNLENVDYWWLMAENAAILGGSFEHPINPKFIEPLKAVVVNDTVLGRLSVYNLVLQREVQMKNPSLQFDPFTGPIKDQNGVLRIQADQRATYQELLSMDWLVEGNIGTPK